SEDFINRNAEAGFNEQQICWSIIVFLFAYWDEEIRPRIASIRGVKTDDVKVDALGDLRLLRKSIIHNGGIVSATDHKKLKVMAALCTPDVALTLTHDQMHKVFVHVKQAIAALILEYTGHLPGAPQASEIVDIGISQGRQS